MIGILLVDDEGSFRTSLAETLRDEGHDVFDYRAPAEIPMLQDLKGIAVLVTDYEMPGQTGLEFADDFHARHPEIPVLLVTAYHTQWLDGEVCNRPHLRLVQKPVTYEAIHALIHEVAGA